MHTKQWCHSLYWTKTTDFHLSMTMSHAKHNKIVGDEKKKTATTKCMHPCIRKIKYTVTATTKQITQFSLHSTQLKTKQKKIAKFIAILDKSIISMHIAKLYLYTFSVSIVWIVYLEFFFVSKCVCMCVCTECKIQISTGYTNSACCTIDYLHEFQL